MVHANPGGGGSAWQSLLARQAPMSCGYPHSFPHLALHLAPGLSYVGSFRNLHCNQETAAECTTRKSSHDPVALGISGHSFHERSAVCVRLASHPEAMLVPFALSSSLPSPLDPVFSAPAYRLGSFRNLHFCQETGGACPRKRVGRNHPLGRKAGRSLTCPAPRRLPLAYTL